MKRISVAVAAVTAVMLAGCGGGNDSPAPAAPPTGGTPTTPATPGPVDFNVYTVQLVGQQGPSYDRVEPQSLDDITFKFDNDESTASVYGSSLPP